MAGKYMYVKLTKEWGGFKVGDVVRFGWNKGEGRVKAGEGEQVPKQRAVNDPIIETTTLTPQSCRGIPETEKAILDIKAKADAKAEIKAKADAKAKKKGRPKTKNTND